MKKVASILLVLCLVVSLVGCNFLTDIADSTKVEEPKTFEFDGISIELTTNFLRMEFVSDKYDFIVGDEILSVFGIKTETKGTDLEDMSASEYAQNFRSLMEYCEPTEITFIDDIPTMQYTEGEAGEEQTCAVTFFKGEKYIWIVCFAAATEDFDDLYEDICSYAKTVKCE